MESPLLNRSTQIEHITSNLETPSLDDRSYRVIRLPNQLEVLLVHDVETDKASAAMDVNVGAFCDLEDMPGIAHAVEHVLFMGTKKYPVENDYSQYLSANSGYSNAYTSATSTNYYFEVAAKPSEESGSTAETSSPFYGALDRFAQFFIEPLFLAETLDRELRAVDSENKKNLQSDPWRMNQLNKSLSNPNHPYCHFSTGNLDTLKHLPEARGVDVRQEFMNFHARHYSANRMKLVVLGREPLDVLEAWTADLFAGVPNKNLSPNRWEDEVPLRPSDLLTQYFVKPVMEERTLTLYFPFLDEEHLFVSKPSRYISHLVGHEGPGSIMAYLKSKGWANALAAYSDSICPGSPSVLTCEIRLTEQGLAQYKEVVKVFFQYAALLKEAPPQEWIFEEQKGMAKVDFKFKQKTPASSFTSRTSGTMHKPIPREWLLSNSTLLREFDGNAISEGLRCLRWDNFRMCLVSQTFPGDWDQREKWYGTEYKYEKIPQDFLEEIKAASSPQAEQRLQELHLPHKNQFIPNKLDVEKKDIKAPAIVPKLIRNDESVRAWFKKDDTFWVPKANLFIECRNPLPGATAANSVKTRFYTELVRDALEEYAYDAELAGLAYSVSNSSSGLNIQLSGYNDKLTVLLEKVLVTMRDLVITEDRFVILKERVSRNLRNWGYGQPYYQVGDFVRWLTMEKGFVAEQTLEELADVTLDDVQNYFPQLLRQMHIETFVHGNIYKEDALRLTKLVETTLKPRPLPQLQWPVRRSLILPPGSNFRYNRILKDPKNVNHCIQYLLTIGDKADRVTKAKALLIEQLTHEPVFDQLRSKEQLGYVVFSGYTAHQTRMGYYLLIQSERTPEYLESRIDSFLVGYVKTLADMTETEFEGHKRALINKRLEKMKNLGQESSRLWTHIDSEYLDFDAVNLDVACIKALGKPEMIEFFDEYINPASKQRAKLAVHMHALGTSPVASTPQSEVVNVDTGSAANGGTATDSGILASVTAAAERATEVLSSAIQSLGIGADQVTTSSPVVVIENVREFKSRLQVSGGPQPVRHLSEFAEVDVKL